MNKKGDRNDATWIKDVDGLHALMPFMMPNRTDNEAVLTDKVDLAPIREFINSKKVEGQGSPYTIFYVLCAGLMKTIALRPKLNHFIEANRLYERNNLSLSFVIKKNLSDDSRETLAVIRFDDTDRSPLEVMKTETEKISYQLREKDNDITVTQTMDDLAKYPRWVLSIIAKFLRKRDYKGKYPKSLMDGDPAYCSLFLTNLGSVKLSAKYHHLANWGTNSFFIVINEKKWEPLYNKDGIVKMREVVELGMTIDERIADGLYFANSIKLFQKIMKNPKILEQPIYTPVD